ncbi:MAG TPA: phosphatase PAP2 family protein [Candidatus Acidoferrum sp.]|nr:phosphatase PAP2 family protein [Candidatus Acidoferrum sp.]
MLVFAAFLIGSLPLAAQEKPDTPNTSATMPGASTAACCSNIGRSVSLRQLPGNLLTDQKEIWLFPTKLAKGEHIWPTIAIVGTTAGFFASDPYSAPPFRNTTDFTGFNRALSSTNTGAFIAAIPAAMYGIGWIRKDSYAQETALLAGEAFADGYLLNLPFKAITGRRAPITYTGNGPYSDSFFNGTHNPLHSGGFYSGHTMAAMSVATVIARRYHSHRWVPFVAYGLAGAISFSRVTRSNHFPGDVFFGGAAGFVIAQYVVLPQSP